MKLTNSTVEHIINLACLREKRELDRNENIELYDSIDCLDLEELSVLYALVNIGIRGYASEADILTIEAKQKGFGIVDELFGLKQLGSFLKVGYSILEDSAI